jgi:hypothetical protein
MTLQLEKDARPDERFYLSYRAPRLTRRRDWWRCRSLAWEPGPFRSFTVRLRGIDETHFRGLQLYLGKLWGDRRGGKLDHTRTLMLRAGHLGGTAVEQQMGYVYTATPSEQWAVRIKQLDIEPVWTNMGGA